MENTYIQLNGTSKFHGTLCDGGYLTPYIVSLPSWSDVSTYMTTHPSTIPYTPANARTVVVIGKRLFGTHPPPPYAVNCTWVSQALCVHTDMTRNNCVNSRALAGHCLVCTLRIETFSWYSSSYHAACALSFTPSSSIFSVKGSGFSTKRSIKVIIKIHMRLSRDIRCSRFQAFEHWRSASAE